MLERLSTNTLCYEAIQRKYRNSVVEFIRKRLSLAFPDDSEERLRKLIKEEEWTRITEDANIRRTTGEIDAHIRDNFDYLGVNHFYNIFDKYFDVLFDVGEKQPEVVREEKSAILRWIKSIKNLRDPLSHPAEEDFSLLDAITMIDCARRVVAKFNPDVELEIEKVIDELNRRESQISSLVRHLVRDTLPSRETIAIDFVGRQEELSVLNNWFKDSETKLWVLAGDGGKGKTAIAYQFGINTKHQSPEEYEIILWLSAKRRRFVEGTITYVDSPDFTDLKTAINKLLAGYGFIAESPKTLEEKRALTLELLTELPALVIVDDLDSLEGEDESAIAFFTFDVTKTRSKVLLTSRRSLFGLAGITTQVKGFSRNDGIKFIQSRIELFGLNPKDFATPYIDKILHITDGSPLYIEELLRLCCIGVAIKEAIEAWEEKGGDTAREYSLKREFDMLSDNAKQILLACCLNRRPSTIEDIAVITGLKRELVLRAVAEIERLFLMPKPTIIKEVPRFDVNVNTRALVLEVMNTTDLYKKIDGNVRRLAGELQISGKRRLEISEYLKHAATLMKLDRFTEAETVLKEGLVKYPEDPDVLAQLGRTYARWKPSPRLTDARTSFRRAAELKCMQEDMYHHWWSLECKDHEWSAAVEAGESGLKQFTNSWKLKYRAGYAHSRLGTELRAQFQRDRARYQLKRARSLLEDALQSVSIDDLDPIDRELHADILRCLVLNCEAQGHVISMEKFLRRWTEYHPSDSEAERVKVRLKNKFPNLAI